MEGNLPFDKNSKYAPVLTTKACSIGGAGTHIPFAFNTSRPGISPDES